MTLEVNTNDIVLLEDNLVNEGEYNVKKINFEFSEEYTDLIKRCRFITDEETYEEDILDNQCEIPIEVTSQNGYIHIGVYAYDEIEGVLALRYSPSPLKYLVRSGSYKEDGEIIRPERLITIEQSLDSDSEANVPSVHAVKRAIDQLDVSGFEAGDNVTFEEDLETGKTIINATDTVYDDTAVRSLIDGVDDRVDELGNYVDNQIEAVSEQIPTNTSDLTNDSGFIDNTVNNLTNYTKTSDLATVATSGSYNDLSNQPTIPDVSSFITKDVNNLTYYTLATGTGNNIELSINGDTYVMTLNLKNSAGTIISTDNIDLPLETMVVGASYDSATKEIILTLKSGSTTRFSVADLVSGLQTEITSSNKLSSDLVDDTNNTNKFVTSAEKTQIATNTTNITNIKDGTNIDSFGDVETELSNKQNTLTAGDNITIDSNNVISASGGSGVIITYQNYENQNIISAVDIEYQKYLNNESYNIMAISNAVGSSTLSCVNVYFAPSQYGQNINILKSTISRFTDNMNNTDKFGYIQVGITISNGHITRLNSPTLIEKSYLAKTNTTEYTPTSNYNPATKKYVDDSVANIPTLQYSTMPTADDTNVDKIIQYIGTTDSTYTNGYFYKCVEDSSTSPSTYSWENVEVQTSSGGGSTLPIVEYTGTNWSSSNPRRYSTFTNTDKTNFQPIVDSILDGTFKDFILNAPSIQNDSFNQPFNSWKAYNVNGIIYLTNINYLWDATTSSSINSTRIQYISIKINTNATTNIITSGTLFYTIQPLAYNYNGSQITNLRPYTYLGINNTNSYTPTGDYNPATKKYVDDAIAGAGGGGIEYYIITNNNYSTSETLQKVNEAYQKFLNNEPYYIKLSNTTYNYIGSQNVYFGSSASNSTNINQLKSNMITIFDANNKRGYCYIYINLTISNNTVTYIAPPSVTTLKYLETNNTNSYTPTGDYNPATKKYVDDKLTTYSGYDATKTQILKNINGTLTWVDE